VRIKLTCSIHDRIATFARLIPCWRIARLERICPRNDRNVITNVNSIVLARNAVNNAAEDGEKDPRSEIVKPYRGLTIAMIKNSPEKMVE
jgi:hypothetical protein